MTDNPRRDLLKKAAALGIGAIASANSASSRAGGDFEQANQKPGDADFFPGFRKLTSNGAGLRPSLPKHTRWLRPISAGMETAASPRMGKTTLAIRSARRRKTRWK